jgi:hypothetical protein
MIGGKKCLFGGDTDNKEEEEESEKESTTEEEIKEQRWAILRLESSGFVYSNIKKDDKKYKLTLSSSSCMNWAHICPVSRISEVCTVSMFSLLSLI